MRLEDSTWGRNQYHDSGDFQPFVKNVEIMDCALEWGSWQEPGGGSGTQPDVSWVSVPAPVKLGLVTWLTLANEISEDMM